MGKNGFGTRILIMFLTVLIYGIIQDYLSRNFSEMNPILLAPFAAVIFAILMKILFGKDVEV